MRIYSADRNAPAMHFGSSPSTTAAAMPLAVGALGWLLLCILLAIAVGVFVCWLWGCPLPPPIVRARHFFQRRGRKQRGVHTWNVNRCLSPAEIIGEQQMLVAASFLHTVCESYLISVCSKQQKQQNASQMYLINLHSTPAKRESSVYDNRLYSTSAHMNGSTRPSVDALGSVSPLHANTDYTSSMSPSIDAATRARVNSSTTATSSQSSMVDQLVFTRRLSAGVHGECMCTAN
jgi:hypothetical protein